MKRVQAILSGHDPGFGSGSSIIHSMSLDEANKQRVIRWKKGDRIPPRRAEVLAMSNGESHVLTVDLNSGRVVSDLTSSTSGYPMLTMDDIIAVSQVPFKSVEFNQSIEARGIPSSGLLCITPFAGWFGPDEEGR